MMSGRLMPLPAWACPTWTPCGVGYRGGSCRRSRGRPQRSTVADLSRIDAVSPLSIVPGGGSGTDHDMQRGIGSLARVERSGSLADGSAVCLERVRTSAHNLPLQRTRLIGRDQDVLAARKALLDAEGHLLTLTGAGGCGKTRLALQVGRELVDAFDDGVWLSEFASLADASLVPQVVATEALTASLQRLELLLVLDNCEHLVEACAELADRLLADCPGLRILATSRADPPRERGGLPGGPACPALH
jgi:hypothetical protein